MAERKPAGKTGAKVPGEAATLEKIAAMNEPFRGMGERIHALVVEAAPDLTPTTWYGMPAYAKNGRVICFFRADKGSMTFGLTLDANHALDHDATDQLRPSSWILDALDDATEARLAAIVRKAAS